MVSKLSQIVGHQLASENCLVLLYSSAHWNWGAWKVLQAKKSGYFLYFYLMSSACSHKAPLPFLSHYSIHPLPLSHLPYLRHAPPYWGWRWYREAAGGTRDLIRWHDVGSTSSGRPPGAPAISGRLTTDSGVHVRAVFVTPWTVATFMYLFLSNLTTNITLHPFKRRLTCYLPWELFLNLTVQTLTSLDLLKPDYLLTSSLTHLSYI